jgi:hypothetical protein
VSDHGVFRTKKVLESERIGPEIVPHILRNALESEFPVKSEATKI